MRDAVRKVLMYGAFHQGVIEQGKKIDEKNFVFSLVTPGSDNEKIGERVRACVEAYGFLDEAFLNMLKLNPKTVPTKPVGNPAV